MNEQRKALGRREKERMNERNGEGEGMNGRKNKRMNGRKKEQMKGRTSKTRRAVAIATVCIPFPVCLSRASLTSYSTSMVTMALSASVSKLQPAEICLTSF